MNNKKHTTESFIQAAKKKAGKFNTNEIKAT
jgi:hypothetical protein